MSKKDTYSDAMNEWAAKQSFFRNRSNRLIHPDPMKPGFARFVGYLIRIAFVGSVIWLVGVKLAGFYFKGDGFNNKLQAEITGYIDASELDAEKFDFIGSKAICKRLGASGSETAPYRSLEASSISFNLPLLKRFREAWAIDHLHVENLDVDLKSGGKFSGSPVALSPSLPPFMHAGLIPNPDFEKLTIGRITCGTANFNWGLTQATAGALVNGKFELTSESAGWRADFQQGRLRQNWIHDLQIEQLRVRRADRTLTFSDSEVRLGDSTEPGNLDGTVTLGEKPDLDLTLSLPSVSTRDLIPRTSLFQELFISEDIKLDLRISGSTNTRAGVETSGTASVSSGMFRKIPVLEAIDQLLKSNSFRIFSIDEGSAQFRTREGKLECTQFRCQPADGTSVLRGSFTYSPTMTRSAATISLSPQDSLAREDHIKGKLFLGLLPAAIEGNKLAQKYFTEQSEGYVWIEIPLDAPLRKATMEQQASILEAVRASKR